MYLSILHLELGVKQRRLGKNSPARGDCKGIEGSSSGNNRGHDGSQKHSGCLSSFFCVLSLQESTMKLGPDNEPRTFTKPPSPSHMTNSHETGRGSSETEPHAGRATVESGGNSGGRILGGGGHEQWRGRSCANVWVFLRVSLLTRTPAIRKDFLLEALSPP